MEPLELRRAPLLAAACCFAIGLIAARSWQPAAMLAISCVLLFVLALVALRGSFRVAVVPVAGLWIVAGMWCWHIRPVPGAQKELLQYADGLSREVRGHVVRVRVLAPAASEGADQDPSSGAEAEQSSSSALSVDIAVDAAEGGASWQQQFDDAGVFCRGCSKGCRNLGGQGQHVRASASGGDRPNCGSAYAALPDG